MSEAAKHAGQPTSSGAEIDEQTRRDFLIGEALPMDRDHVD